MTGAGSDRPKIALFVDRPDWHARGLQAGFAARGAEAVFVSLQDCGFRTARPDGPFLPGFGTALPDGAFVRCVPGGSFEQVTMRLGVLHALRECGVPVRNDARAIERCVDKSMTSFLLAKAGLPTPPTWVCESLDEASAIAQRECASGGALVLKPLFGSQGRGLRLIHNSDELPESDVIDGVFYLQRFVGPEQGGWRDFRVFVSGDRALAAMVRVGRGWITNVKQGADYETMVLDERLAGMAVAAAQAVGAGYAGVDITLDRDGSYQVLEVNSMPAWSALQKVSASDISQSLADDFLASLAARRDPEVTVDARRRIER